ncbi:hypothetical protein [Patulibacter defluvii]|uniref:hypothetical protein n=1 Tax=Patulibacter defluvii TaxID=3095358 RepID=UPI002A749650|nr:hypothetical protein [Patulibacter sp. DM4]
MGGRRRAPGRIAVLVLMAAATTGLTACGGGDDSRGDGDRGDAKGRKAALADVPVRDLTPIPALRKPVGARVDVRAGRCVTRPGRVRVAGTVTNPTRRRADYVIAVNWISARSDVRQRAVTTVPRVGAGATRRWALRTRLRARNAVQCTYFVQRGALR